MCTSLVMQHKTKGVSEMSTKIVVIGKRIVK